MPIDYSRYPPNWKSEIVPRILERANHCCEKCGVPNKAILTSIPLKVREGDRYKTRRIWITDASDVKRLLPLMDTEYDGAKKITVVLTIAHLDHDEENHEVSDDRLQAMCQICHLNYDAKEKHRRRLEKCNVESV